MAPKCAMTALPTSREQLKRAMLEMGAEVNLDGLRAYVVGHGNVLVHSAFHVSRPSVTTSNLSPMKDRRRGRRMRFSQWCDE